MIVTLVRDSYRFSSPKRSPNPTYACLPLQLNPNPNPNANYYHDLKPKL